jgi:hypothetical protein
MPTKSPTVVIYRLLAACACAAVAFAGCGGGAPSSSAIADRETWDVFCIHGQRVGYAQTTLRHATKDGRPIVQVAGLSHVAIQRFGKLATQETKCTSTETPDGQLLDFQSEISQGATPLRTTGAVRGNQLELKTSSSGKDIAASIAWADNYGGFYAVEESLLRQPMQPGQKRSVAGLEISNQVAHTELTARDYEQVKLLAGSFKLLRIDAVMKLPDGQIIRSVEWTDLSGETLKSLIEGMEIETFRVPKEVALAETEPAKFDLGTDTLVKIERPLPNAHDSKQIRYRVQLEGGNPAEIFVAGPSQQVKSTGPHTAEVTVYAIRPGRNDGNRGCPADPPTDAARQPNNFIQSDDAKVVADAKEAAGDETDPWKVAVALERYVNRAMTKKNYSDAFATAADVARKREGDCKAHAVYLAALARARGIPARVAVGLVYVQQLGAFTYHMWTEAYIDNRWIPIDGTLGKGGIGAAHLKLGQGCLDGVAAYSSFLTLGQITGRLKVEVIDAE